jgi:hypothetical protein
MASAGVLVAGGAAPHHVGLGDVEQEGHIHPRPTSLRAEDVRGGDGPTLPHDLDLELDAAVGGHGRQAHQVRRPHDLPRTRSGAGDDGLGQDLAPVDDGAPARVVVALVAVGTDLLDVEERDELGDRAHRPDTAGVATPIVTDTRSW